MGKIIYEIVLNRRTDQVQEEWAFNSIPSIEAELVRSLTQTDTSYRATAAQAYQQALNLRNDEAILGIEKNEWVWLGQHM